MKLGGEIPQYRSRAPVTSEMSRPSPGLSPIHLRDAAK